MAHHACRLISPPAAGSTGTVTCAVLPGVGNNYTVAMSFGTLALPAGGLSVSGSAYGNAVDLGPGQAVTWTGPALQ